MSRPAVLVATARLLPGKEDAFLAWQVGFNEALEKTPGYVSSDFMPPARPGENEWTSILTFQSADALLQWQQCQIRARLVGDLLPLLEAGKLEEIISKDDASEQAGGPVTQLIITRIKSGMEDAFRSWSVRIQQIQARYPGYRGMYVQPPAASHGHWTVILRYDSREHLEAWMASPERESMLREAGAFVEEQELVRPTTSFPGWVPVDPATGQGPPSWKAALLVLLGLFPIVMLEMRFMGPQLRDLGIHSTVIVFLSNLLTVMLTGCVTMPPFVRWFRWWLFPKSKSATVKGVAILCALFVVEIALCWNL